VGVESSPALPTTAGSSELRMGRAKSKGAKFAAVKKIISKKTIKK
jgi:hypothetical protein